MEKPLEGLRVLVVDDYQANLDLVCIWLSTEGAEVECVRNPQDAVQKVVDWRPDVLLSDLMMPNLDGYQLIQQIRALDPSLGGRTPAIALSVIQHERDQKRALKAGYQLFLPKPSTVDPLISAIQIVAPLKSN